MLIIPVTSEAEHFKFKLNLGNQIRPDLKVLKNLQGSWISLRAKAQDSTGKKGRKKGRHLPHPWVSSHSKSVTCPWKLSELPEGLY